MENLSPFMNKENRLILWPKKQAKKVAILQYLAGKFQDNINYDEQEVNLILRQWSDYNDIPMLRRSLIDFGYLTRDKYGKQYKKVAESNRIDK